MTYCIARFEIKITKTPNPTIPSVFVDSQVTDASFEIK